MSRTGEQREPMWTKMMSGSMGSIVTVLCVNPLEVVKVRQQTQIPAVPSLPPNVQPCPSCGVCVIVNGSKECVPMVEVTPPRMAEMPTSGHRGTLTMLREIWMTEGVAGMYAGIRPTLAMAIPNTVIYFTSYEALKESLDQHSHSRSHYNTFLSPSGSAAFAGAAARLVATIATSPLELIRTQQAAQVGGANGGLLSAFRKVIRSGGIPSLYKGLSPTLARDVPFSAVYWVSIERLRKAWGDSSDRSALQQAGQALFNGCVSGMISAAVTTPMDVLKTHRQVTTEAHAHEASVVCHHRGAIQYKPPAVPSGSLGTFSLVRKIVEEEGIAGLWKGNAVRMAKVAPACAIMLSSYEIGKRALSS